MDKLFGEILSDRLQSFTDVAMAFREAADLLFGNYVLQVKGKAFYFTELEFYLQSAAHPDPYVHASAKQGRRGYWYFHRHKNDRTIKEGTWKGMDLTFGNARFFGGILIRGIRAVHSEGFISGPCKVVDELIAHYYFKTARQLAEHAESTPVMKNKWVGLMEKPRVERPFFSTSRIGLALPVAVFQQEYFERPYRFVCELSPAHKMKEKERVIWAASQSGKVSEEELKKMLGYMPDLNRLKERYGD